MGKILKYCSSCEEGFAERFTFCPDCGASLQAVEVNPVVKEEKIQAEEPATPAFISEPEIVTASFVAEPEPLAEEPPMPEVFDTVPAETIENLFESTNGYETSYQTGPLDLPEEEVSEPEPAAEEPVSATAGAFYQTPDMYADEPYRPAATRHDDDGYYVTVIQEKNVKQRNVLLLSATGFVLAVVMTVVLIDLFQKELLIGAVDDNPLFSAVLFEDIPMMVEEEQQKKDDDEGGGGGGGGKNAETPASRGDLPDLVRNPVRPPDVNTPRFENPSLPIPPPQLEGPPLRTPKEYGRWGVPDGLDGPPSDGPGSGGGIGSGTGTGVGSGRGTGAGSGTGSGLGSGRGDGIGSGTGSGTGGNVPPPIRTVTENYRIISKPKPPYTDAARANNVQGTVRLKVTLLASGQVGSVTPVTRLPHGLTEQAIAAARQIRFSPKKVNGISQSVIVTLDYGFNIY